MQKTPVRRKPGGGRKKSPDPIVQFYVGLPESSFLKLGIGYVTKKKRIREAQTLVRALIAKEIERREAAKKRFGSINQEPSES